MSDKVEVQWREVNDATDPSAEYRKASEKMGHIFTNTSYFILNALDWLGELYGDVHLEYHECEGWQVSTCYADDSWGENGWIRGDGSMQSALCKAVAVAKQPEQVSDAGSIEGAPDGTCQGQGVPTAQTSRGAMSLQPMDLSAENAEAIERTKADGQYTGKHDTDEGPCSCGAWHFKPLRNSTDG